MTDFVCIGAPYFIGERIAARTEIAALKASGIAAELGAPWVDIAPDLDASPDPITAVCRALAETIRAHADRIPLIFSSDCVNALGAMKGLEHHQPDVLWMDAHGDFNTPETSPGGFLGGMPLAWLVGRGDLRYMTGLGLSPIREEQVTLTDARNLDPGEAVAVQNSAVTHLKHVDDLLNGTWSGRPLYLHLDIDVVDSSEMPAMIYPEPDGPSVEQVSAALTHVAQSANVVGVLCSLWDNSLPGADQSMANALRLVRALTGAMA